MNSTTVRILRVATGVASGVAPALAAHWLERLFLTPTRHTMPVREETWLLGSRSCRLQFDRERSFPVHIWGEGPVALLAHGWSGRGSQMGAFVRPLLQAGYQVVAFDAPGHGQAEGRLSGLPVLADTIEKVSQFVGSVQVLVAHSLGTSAATIALSRGGLAPDRVVYVSPPDQPVAYIGRAAKFLGFSSQVSQRAQHLMERRFDFSMSDADVCRLAKDLRAKLLVLHDRNDREVPFAEGQNLAAHWPDCELRETEGLGHRRILRDPEVVRQAVEFLAPQALVTA